ELDRIFITDNLQEKLQNLTAPDEVNKKDLENKKQTDVMRILKQVSGTYMREEDGQGLRPNIGMRGTHPDRSKKIVLMEDEVLISPAPYSAPAAYFTPSMQTTESLQVYKGFASVPWGPNSIGGSINYITKQIPKNGYQKVDASYGSFNTRIFSAEAGDSFLDRYGVLISASRMDSDGFKTLPRGQNTGFVKNDLLLKTSWNISKRQYLRAKVGFSTENSNETYVGLANSDFLNNPYQRYASSELDNMDWQHQRFQLEHGVQIGSNGFLKTLAYHNQFNRVWFRLDRFGNNQLSVSEVLNNPTGTNAFYYEILKGQRNSSTIGPDGNLILANNDRRFLSSGLQSSLTLNSDFGSMKNEFIWGGRLHQDSIERNHTLRTAQMINSALSLTGDVQLGQLNKNEALAASTFIENNLSYGDLKWTLVGRYEDIRFRDLDRKTNIEVRANDQFFLPGTGLSYKLSPVLAVKASINSALNVAGLGTFGRNERESATNYETGLRYNGTQFNSDLNFFFNDYDNITGTCSASGGCLADADIQFNGGKARVYGLELSAGTLQHFQGLRFPVQSSLTLMSAEFANTFSSNSPEWGIGTVTSGSRLPYIPRIQYNINIGVEYKKIQNNINFTYQGDIVDQSLSQNQIRIGGYGIIDLISRYNYSKNGSLYVKADNLLGLDYVVAARPFGLRPGKPQAFGFGITQTF
ncbi:TonB-dependent receptor, partial [bacterium]|nr:TonB-dependent receptor [bacterium]